MVILFYAIYSATPSVEIADQCEIIARYHNVQQRQQ